MVLLFFIQMSSNFPANCDSVLRTNVWKNENLNCGVLASLFPSNAISKFFYLASLVINS